MCPIWRKKLQKEPFITYMGMGQCDIRIVIQYNEDIENQRKATILVLKQDQEIETFVEYANGYEEVENTEGEMERLL